MNRMQAKLAHRLAGLQFDGTNGADTFDGTRRDDIFSGLDGTDIIKTGAGNDIVLAGAGSDSVWADFGDDTLNGGSGYDIIYFDAVDFSSENPGGDINETGIRCDLAKTGRQNTGITGFDTIFGFEIVVASTGNDRVWGNSVSNRIEGLDGNDFLDGRGGDDQIYAGDGKNTIIGGTGQDTIFLEGTNSDRLIFRSQADSPAVYYDYILNFMSAGSRIDLSPMDADPGQKGNQAFEFIGHSTFSTGNPGEVRWNIINSNDVLVTVNTDNDKAAEMAIYLSDISAVTLSDFIL